MGPDFASRHVQDKVLSLLRNYAALYCGLHRLKMPSIFLGAPALCGRFNILLLSKYSQLKCKYTELNYWSKTHYGVYSMLIINLLSLSNVQGIVRLRYWDKEKNQCIREKTGAQNIVKEIKQYQKKWLQHVQRIDTNRIPKQALQYRPKGRRNIGWPKKRWRDQLHFENQGKENTPNLSWTCWWWGITIWGNLLSKTPKLRFLYMW